MHFEGMILIKALLNAREQFLKIRIINCFYSALETRIYQTDTIMVRVKESLIFSLIFSTLIRTCSPDLWTGNKQVALVSIAKSNQEQFFTLRIAGCSALLSALKQLHLLYFYWISPDFLQML